MMGEIYVVMFFPIHRMFIVTLKSSSVTISFFPSTFMLLFMLVVTLGGKYHHAIDMTLR